MEYSKEMRETVAYRFSGMLQTYLAMGLYPVLVLGVKVENNAMCVGGFEEDRTTEELIKIVEEFLAAMKKGGGTLYGKDIMFPG